MSKTMMGLNQIKFSPSFDQTVCGKVPALLKRLKVDFKGNIGVIKKFYFFKLVWYSMLFFSTTVSANSLAYVPPALADWVPWVQQRVPQSQCPFDLSQSPARQCLWAGHLRLSLQAEQLVFRQSWVLYAAGWIVLPGGYFDVKAQHWPKSVKLNGRPVAVVMKDKRPVIWAEKGQYQVSGLLPISAKTNYLWLPQQAALVLWDQQKQPEFSQVDSVGRLWLKPHAQIKPDVLNEAWLSYRVYRRFDDAVPVRIQTLLELEVGGPARTIVLKNLLLPDTQLLGTHSELALQNKGQDLNVQLKAGRWSIELDSRATQPIKQIKVPDIYAIAVADLNSPDQPEHRPQARYWVLAPDTHLRMLTTTGLESVDPAQTPVPSSWHQLSVYQAQTGALWQWQASALPQRPAHEALVLERQVWLDFNGPGMTVLDHITGQLNHIERLSAFPLLKLGAATAHDQPVVINTLNEQDQGLALRQNPLDLSVVAQLSDRSQELLVTGWKAQFSQVDWLMEVPPQWALLAVIGADRVKGAWWTHWRLWDVFWVVLLTVGFVKVCQLWVGVLMGAVLSLTYATPLSLPPILWALTLLSLLAARFSISKPVLLHLRTTLTVLVLLLWSVLLAPNLYQGVKAIIFGATFDTLSWRLESPENSQNRQLVQLNSFPVPSKMSQAQVMGDRISQEAGVSSYQSFSKLSESGQSMAPPMNSQAQQLVQANSVQTGPGLPSWQYPYQQIRLGWSGPILADDTVKFYWLGPVAVRLLKVVILILSVLAFLTVVYWLISPHRFLLPFLKHYPLPELLKKLPKLSMALLVWFGFFALVVSPPLHAEQWPTPELLKEVEKRMMAPPQCLPDCFAVSEGHVSLDGQKLRLSMRLYVQTSVGIPMPYLNTQLHWPDTIELENLSVGNRSAKVLTLFNPATETNELEIEAKTALEGMGRAQAINHHTLLFEPGIFSVTLVGKLSDSSPVQLIFPWVIQQLKVAAKGWVVEGLNQGRLTADALFLQPERETQRMPNEDQSQWVATQPEPFVQVQRFIEFGHQVQVFTEIIRQAPKQGALNVRVDLLPGESVLDEHILAELGVVKVSLSDGQNRLGWRSNLEIDSQLNQTQDDQGLKSVSWTIQAKQQPHYVERWRFKVSRNWHLKFEGLLPIIENHDPKVAQNSHLITTYWPEPGDRLTLEAQRLDAAPGAKLTINSAQYQIKPGLRVSEALLNLKVTNTVGRSFPIQLPSGAHQVSLLVDGQPVPVSSQSTSLKPMLTPGYHHIQVKFSLPLGISSYFVVPEVALPNPLANLETSVRLSASRWVLWASGEGVGTRVSFWAAVLLILLSAPIIGRLSLIPLTSVQWVLLATGFSLCFWPGLVVLLATMLALKTKPMWSLFLRSPLAYNCAQLILMALSLMVLLGFVIAVPRSLLAKPNMALIGPGSAYEFVWYLDRLKTHFPQYLIISLPIWCYRLIMLLWSLWLANRLLSWGQWAWQQIGSGGWFKPKQKQQKQSKSEDTLKEQTSP